jgi:hypothetical protein
MKVLGMAIFVTRNSVSICYIFCEHIILPPIYQVLIPNIEPAVTLFCSSDDCGVARDHACLRLQLT